ncbi:MAG: DUF3592 domain-containing protein [Alphaproteobacteria bacterium]|nr:DUF3592 domain-containing protein [Alphaproteobacteria bacterium]
MPFHTGHPNMTSQDDDSNMTAAEEMRRARDAIFGRQPVDGPADSEKQAMMQAYAARFGGMGMGLSPAERARQTARLLKTVGWFVLPVSFVVFVFCLFGLHKTYDIKHHWKNTQAHVTKIYILNQCTNPIRGTPGHSGGYSRSRTGFDETSAADCNLVYDVRLSYAYTVDGKLHVGDGATTFGALLFRHKKDAQSWVNRHKRGTALTVRYNPSHPGDVTVYDAYDMDSIATLLVMTGILVFWPLTIRRLSRAGKEDEDDGMKIPNSLV